MLVGEVPVCGESKSSTDPSFHMEFHLSLAVAYFEFGRAL